MPRFQAHGFESQQAGQAQRVPAGLVANVRTVPGVRAAVGSLTGYAQPRNALNLGNRARVMIHQNGLYGSTLVSRILPLGRMPHLLDHNRADAGVSRCSPRPRARTAARSRPR